MIQVSRVVVFLISFIVVESNIFLHHTHDKRGTEDFDCVLVQSSLWYCRRPRASTDFVAEEDNATQPCTENGGEKHLFSDLRSKNITVSTVQHQWTTTLEQVEEYSLYLKDLRLADGRLCRCLQLGTFGVNCEYQLPAGETFEETLQWQLLMRDENPQEVQIHGDVVCYETFECNSGVLCLDWREICDGVQQCLEGRDEENCDLLEMNQCDEDEYRCMNGMCIPDEFFLDGELDCLDWSDELSFKDSRNCPGERVSTECDDHLDASPQWSCGDGQYIGDRLGFQRSEASVVCGSGRDQYFICETHPKKVQWTMPNGRCYEGRVYVTPSVINSSDQELCEYLLRCTLSAGGDIGCPCKGDSGCADELERICPWSMIQYPRGAVVTPYLFFLYNSARDWRDERPDLISINGTVRCRGSLVTLRKFTPFHNNLDGRLILEAAFCRSLLINISSSNSILADQQCHNANESTDRCDEWNRCLSVTRINDGRQNCLNERDEEEQTEMEIEKSCARVRRHRFRCSEEQPECFSVTRLGDRLDHCRNRFDELLFGVGRALSSMNCNDRRQDECLLLREYVDQSWKSLSAKEAHSKLGIPFRSYCDTFGNLETTEDEDLLECQRWWICADDQRRCPTGQCIDKSWLRDHEWDCADAWDEYHWLNFRAQSALRGASVHNFDNRSYFVPRQCNQSQPFLCLSSEATQQGFSCFNLSQIGDGQVDCAGAMDEANTLRHCSQPSILGYHYRCPSTNTCIPYFHHCLTENYRCPNRSDDEHWCNRQYRPENCFDRKDFVCFDGRCFKGGRCNLVMQCSFGEDEYMCDYYSSQLNNLIPNRQKKRFILGFASNVVRFSSYPADANIAQLNSHSITTTPSLTTDNSDTSSSSSSLLSPYWCNRGLGVLMTKMKNHSVCCFCPPQYFGEKCQYHADRLSVLLYLDLSQSIYSSENHPTVLFKLLVIFLLNDEIVQRDRFHLHSSSQIINTLVKKKIISQFLYPQSPSAREQRFFNRSDLLFRHPYSVRIELYQASLHEQPSLIGVWKYPLPFDQLPVTRLAKVLRLASSVDQRRNPCLSHPCHPDERCYPLMNDNFDFICLCPTNFTGPNCSIRDSQCSEGYCLTPSLCQPDVRSSSPFCLCPSTRYGGRCSIEHDVCLSHPCLNNGSCFPDSQPDRVICLCPKEYSGFQCQWKRPFIHLSLFTHLPYAGAVIQFFDIDLSSLELIPADQQVFRTIPDHIEYYHRDKTTITGIVLIKLYSSLDERSTADLHLLSVHVNVFSLIGTTEISPINRCEHLRTFTNSNFFTSFEFHRSSCVHSDSSPIRYHQICRDNLDLLCFRDDLYLCLCAENHTRVECFLYPDELDRCPHCLDQGRCLKGDLRRSNDFLCLCRSCHSGRQCQFNTKSFSFTLDQLFSPDLLLNRRSTTLSLLIFFSVFIFFFALLNNLFSFLTFRRSSCLRHGVVHYLLWMSVFNQLSLALLLARLLHLILNVTGISSSSSQTNDLLCKSLNYLLSSSTRLVYWLTSLISIERLYTTLFLRGQWLKQPRIARRLILCIAVAVFITDLYELFFYKSFFSQVEGQGSICVLQISPSDQPLWTTCHLLFLILHSLLPFLINLSSTITITLVVIQKKINTHSRDSSISRLRLIAGVLNENKEFVLGPAITLVPQLFSLPLFISSFIFDCQNLEDSWLRHFLIVSYWISFTPQWTSFFLYIVPSSFYSSEWRRTKAGRWIYNLLRRHVSAAPAKTTFTGLW